MPIGIADEIPYRRLLILLDLLPVFPLLSLDLFPAEMLLFLFLTFPSFLPFLMLLAFPSFPPFPLFSMVMMMTVPLFLFAPLGRMVVAIARPAGGFGRVPDLPFLGIIGGVQAHQLRSRIAGFPRSLFRLSQSLEILAFLRVDGLSAVMFLLLVAVRLLRPSAISGDQQTESDERGGQNSLCHADFSR